MVGALVGAFVGLAVVGLGVEARVRLRNVGL